MTRPFYLQSPALSTGIALISLAILPINAAHAAFNPNADTPSASASPTLPDPTVIYDHSSSTPAPAPNYASPLAPVQMPGQPLYPARVDSAAQTPETTAVTAPIPVQNQSVVMSPPSPASPPPVVPTTTSAGASSGFIAPAPVLAQNPLAQPASTHAPEKTAQIPNQPVPTPPTAASTLQATPPMPHTMAPDPSKLAVVPAQIQQASREAAQAATPKPSELSPQTRAILSHIPGNIDQSKPPGTHITLDRVSPDVDDVLGDKAKEQSYEAVGLSMKVRRPGLDENYELNRAYAALMGGDTDTAIETYKNILSTNPTNQDALFGLAATYHRLGNLEKARPLYGMLLKLNPNHREGLNNFLALVADESPQDALPELERLEARNPEFSPIPAQIAVVLNKLGYAEEARSKMLHAIELAPDNLTYKYNLAVMLDHQGQAVDAMALYTMLIDASLHGQAVPAPVAAMQKRVNYLADAANRVPRTPTASVVAPASPTSPPAAVN